MSLEISAALASLSSLMGIAKTAVEARDDAKAKQAISDMSDRLMAALQGALGLAENASSLRMRLDEAEAELAKLKSEVSERSRYQLAKLGTAGDFFAYRLRPAAELVERQDEPAHFLCQPCLDGGKKVVLHVDSLNAFCPVCQTSIPVRVVGHPPRNAAGLYT